jgi:hypothetical protein
MVHRYVQDNNHGLTIIQVIILYDQRFIYFYVCHWIQWLFCDRRTMLEWGSRLKINIDF